MTRYWNFVATEDAPIDCVTGDVTLTADMREVTLTLLRLEVVQHNKTFEALSKLTAKDVTVYAIYDIQPKVEGMDEYRQALAEARGRISGGLPQCTRELFCLRSQRRPLSASDFVVRIQRRNQRL